MTPEQQAKFDEIKAEVAAGTNIAANLAAQVAPQYAPLIYLGATLVKQAPDLYADVVALLNKEEPTDDDNKALAAKIASLQNPENL